jgi:hypothetical protein
MGITLPSSGGSTGRAAGASLLSERWVRVVVVIGEVASQDVVQMALAQDENMVEINRTRIPWTPS